MFGDTEVAVIALRTWIVTVPLFPVFPAESAWLARSV